MDFVTGYYVFQLNKIVKYSNIANANHVQKSHTICRTMITLIHTDSPCCLCFSPSFSSLRRVALRNTLAFESLGLVNL